MRTSSVRLRRGIGDGPPSLLAANGGFNWRMDRRREGIRNVRWRFWEVVEARRSMSSEESTSHRGITAPRRVRLGVLGSGEGTNMEALAAAIDRGELAADMAVVISDVAEAGVLGKARAR